MADQLSVTVARMLRDHFHQSGMTKECAELDEALEEHETAPEPRKPLAIVKDETKTEE